MVLLLINPGVDLDGNFDSQANNCTLGIILRWVLRISFAEDFNTDQFWTGSRTVLELVLTFNRQAEKESFEQAQY